jgi:hypothetical protein
VRVTADTHLQGGSRTIARGLRCGRRLGYVLGASAPIGGPLTDPKRPREPMRGDGSCVRCVAQVEKYGERGGAPQTRGGVLLTSPLDPYAVANDLLVLLLRSNRVSAKWQRSASFYREMIGRSVIRRLSILGQALAQRLKHDRLQRQLDATALRRGLHHADNEHVVLGIDKIETAARTIPAVFTQRPRRVRRW